LFLVLTLDKPSTHGASTPITLNIATVSSQTLVHCHWQFGSLFLRTLASGKCLIELAQTYRSLIAVSSIFSVSITMFLGTLIIYVGKEGQGYSHPAQFPSHFTDRLEVTGSEIK